MSKIKLAKGILWKLLGKKREPIEDLQDALDDLASCGCGINCCENTIYLKDQNTGETVKITVVDGVLTVTVPE